MSDDQEPDDAASTPDATSGQPEPNALSDAIIAGVRAAVDAVGGPLSDVFGDAIRRAADDSLSAAGIGEWASPASQPLSEKFDLGLGLGSAAQAARDALTRAATRRADEMLGGRGLNEVLGQHAFVSPMDHFKDIRGPQLGLGAGAQAAMDAISQRANEMLGGRAFADMIRPGAFTSPMDHFKDIRGPNLGLGLGSGAQAAMAILGPRQPTFAILDQHGLDHFSGIHSAMDAALAGASRRSVGDLFGGPAAGVADQLRQAALGGYTSPFDEMMRRSQHAIHDFMYGSSRFAEPPAWMDGVSESIAEMMRSLWPLADRGMRAAQAALRTALKVVRMLERNDPQARQAVQKFLLEWLGFRYATWDLVCSATLVLMNVGAWLPDNLLSANYDPRPRLRALTLKEHRAASRLSTDPKLRFRGKPLLSLDQPVKVSDADSSATVLRDLVPDREAPDPAVVDDSEITDPRIVRLWWKFTDREREILREKSKPRVTWPAAAIACGGTAAEGHRLRRKARSLARTDESRATPVRRVTQAS